MRNSVAPLLVVGDMGATFVVTKLLGAYTTHAVAICVVTLILFARRGLYRARLTVSALDQAPAIAGRVIAASASVLAADVLFRSTSANQRHLLLSGILAAFTIVIVRGVIFGFVRAVRRSGAVAHRTLILGAGRVGHDLAHALVEHPEHGLRPIGYWDPDPMLSSEDLGVPVHGAEESLSDVILQTRTAVVLIAFGGAPESRMVDIVRTCDRLACEIFVVPRLYELHQRDADMDEVWGMPLVRLRRPAFRTKAWHVKRLLDIVISLAALVPLAPVLAACALAVRFDGGPGILFRQERVGLDGRRFQVLKFRSMRPATHGESATRWSIADDDRLSKVGKFLRATSLDELPQLWNVLRGDMTLVGPRPERPFFVDQFAEQFPRYVARHRVPAGLTGWAQIHGFRGDTSIEERARFDNYYIENWSLWLDVKILLQTVRTVLRREGG